MTLDPKRPQTAAQYRGFLFAGAHRHMVESVVRLFALYRQQKLDDLYIERAKALAAALRVLWSQCPGVTTEPGMFPDGCSYSAVLHVLRDLGPTTKPLDRRGRRPHMTEAERDWLLLNPEGLTAEQMAQRLDRSLNAVFAVRQPFRRQARVVQRSARGGSLFHLEPAWYEGGELPVAYATRHEAALRWNELYHGYARGADGLVKVSGPFQLLPINL